MVRTRLVMLVTLMALVAPWIAPCLTAAPIGHAAMPCCHSAETQAPAARPCCASGGDDPSLPPTSSAGVSPLAAPPAPSVFLAPWSAERPLAVRSKSLVSVEPRLLFSVLLI